MIEALPSWIKRDENEKSALGFQFYIGRKEEQEADKVQTGILSAHSHE